MTVDGHGYDTGSSENKNSYVPICNKEICKSNFVYKGSALRNDVPDEVK